ncbi:Lysophospholipid acyltransferase LPEAT1 [Porphyridium purpureum]|uniref:Lysophospholipid acyltransferase LPEAT1 n=1 Tax=Porphyridium purpureum TaxID=35688 RepID=A0A5J4Z565_PORPP|nr:Lysophospholipid acyltransferase LPEAT1 [Porphyridium purpureum]|eukprot:POR1087..scf295_1
MDRRYEQGVAESGETAEQLDEQVHAYFYPFKRVSGQWSVYEVCKTALLSCTLLPLRLLLLLIFLIVLWLVAALVQGSPRHGEEAVSSSGSTPDSSLNQKIAGRLAGWQMRLVRVIPRLARLALALCFGVFWIRRRSPEPSSLSPQLKPVSPRASLARRSCAYTIVSNHLGYLDILVLLAVYSGSFVAKEDIRRVRFVGKIACAIQCLFLGSSESVTQSIVGRTQRAHACRVLKQCEGCSDCATNLIIFPEGTTCNGHAMIRFRRGAFAAGLAVLPVVVSFPYKHFNSSWESILFKTHMWRIMTQFVNYVDISELGVYEPAEQEKVDAHLYARNVEKLYSQHLALEIYDLNRKHKLMYHSYLLGQKTAGEVLELASQEKLADPSLTTFEAIP